MGAIPFMEVPYSRGKMRYILEEQAKLAFLVKQIKLPLPVITKGMLNMELFTTADFNVAMLYNRQLNTPIKVFKYLDHKTASKMFNTPTTEFLDQSFKGKSSIDQSAFQIGIYFNLRQSSPDLKAEERTIIVRGVTKVKCSVFKSSPESGNLLFPSH